ncbi:ASPSCR1 isoform 8 [Pan troglodytes]|uniref:ASPSCR1 isoform 8 n=1 Tax=Pan troglodytes TaxID=9598 RepID=A0A2J8JFT3_PANTR|nr:ASPSCR1 isoform 8 [Pan troglodytes]
MAAPAGGGGSAVSVLAPNGRRHTVKVTPSTVLLQVLEDTCRRQDFNPCEYDLKFQRSVLDLSLQWRFANLPNNAKLEMVPASRSREGPENMVRIALQLDDGSRLQDSFCSGQTLWELLSHFPQTRECLQHPGGATPVCVYTRDEVTGEAALRGTTLQSLGLTGGSATIRFVMKRYDPVGKTPGSLGSSASAGQAAASAPLPLESGELSRGDLSRREDADTSGPCCEHTQEKQSTRAPVPAPFVPFSGGGQRLGGPPGPTRPLTSSSAKLPKSLSSPGGPSKPKKSKSGQDPQQEQEQERERDPQQEQERPVDREPVVCHPDLEERLQAWPAELPDEFFELTVDDVRRRLAQLKSERKRLEEAPLVTKAFREAQIKEKLERVALRVLFPDRYVLQGCFRPSETVGDLRDFVRSHLGNPELSFYLFVTPPKTVLDDHTQTLFQPQLGDRVAPFTLGPSLKWCLGPEQRTPLPVVGDGGDVDSGRLLFWGPSRGRASPSTGQPSCHPVCRPSSPPSPRPSSGDPSRVKAGHKHVGTGRANLFPAALVHFGAEEPAGVYLEPGLLEHAISPSAADVLVARYMSRAAGSPSPLPAPDPAPKSEPAAEEGALVPPEPIPGTAQPVKRSLGKVPKWLKLPASKR